MPCANRSINEYGCCVMMIKRVGVLSMSEFTDHSVGVKQVTCRLMKELIDSVMLYLDAGSYTAEDIADMFQQQFNTVFRHCGVYAQKFRGDFIGLANQIGIERNAEFVFMLCRWMKGGDEVSVYESGNDDNAIQRVTTGESQSPDSPPPPPPASCA